MWKKILVMFFVAVFAVSAVSFAESISATASASNGNNDDDDDSTGYITGYVNYSLYVTVGTMGGVLDARADARIQGGYYRWIAIDESDYPTSSDSAGTNGNPQSFANPTIFDIDVWVTTGDWGAEAYATASVWW